METKIEEAASPTMDRRSKILLAVFVVAILLSIGVSFYKFMIARDYIIEARVDCDPAVETCFVWECDPESGEEGEMCTGNPEEDAWYYKVIRKNAMNIPLCNPTSEDCEPIVCMENEPECEYVPCEEGNADGIACSNPEDFAEDAESTGSENVDEDGTDDEPSNDEPVGINEETESGSPETTDDKGFTPPGISSE